MASEGANTHQHTPLESHSHSAHDAAGHDNLEPQAAATTTAACITGGEAQDLHQASVTEQGQQAQGGSHDDPIDVTVPSENRTSNINTVPIPSDSSTSVLPSQDQISGKVHKYSQVEADPAISAASTGDEHTSTSDSDNAKLEEGEQVHTRESETAITSQQASVEQEWPLKSILWPPFVEHPHEVKVLMQDLNGPCSFLALCNVLLLGGDIALPLHQKTATFKQLSELVGDYLLRRTNASKPPTTSDEPSSPILPSDALSFALNMLPKTLSGLDVNLNFITGSFSRSDGSEPGELELFKLANVDFKHGWIVGSDMGETYEVLLTVANDYDTAVQALVEGDAIAEGTITGSSVPNTAALPIANQSESESTEARAKTNEQKLEELFEELSMEPNKQAKVYQATIIQKFLNSTATQLTYPGLFKLSEEMKEGSLCALFRNSHFSVLYRRPDTIEASGSGNQSDSVSNVEGNSAPKKIKLPQATLFQLVTDQALLHEPNAVWESLEDVDGAASSFFDSYLQPAKIRQDWVSRSERSPARVEASNTMHDADMALAAQMQQDEYDAEDEDRRTRSNGNTQSTNRQNAVSQQPPAVPAGTRPEDLDPRVLSGLGAKATKKSKDRERVDGDKKKSKKDCIIC